MSNKKFQIPVFLGIASVWFGTHAGPGAASGKQTAVYYSAFGKWGLITPIFAMGVMAICIYYALEYSRVKGIRNFKEFTNNFFHPYEKVFSTFFEVTSLTTVLMALGGSIAAGAGILNQYLNIPVLAGTGLLVAAAVLLSIYGEKLVRDSSTVMTVFIVLCLLAIVAAGLLSPKADFAGHWQSTSFGDVSFFSAFTMAMVYAGFLCSGNMANAVSVSGGLTSKKESLKSAVVGMIMNVFLILSVAFLLFAYPQYLNETIPNFFVVRETGISILLFAYVLMVVLAVLSTAVSYAFATVARYSPLLPMKEGTKRDFTTLAILFAATFLISLLGLDVIVGKGYKYLGYAVIPTVIIPTILIGSRKIKNAENEGKPVVKSNVKMEAD